jgi:hypothetical protein
MDKWALSKLGAVIDLDRFNAARFDAGGFIGRKAWEHCILVDISHF